jgi:purine nucleosidase/pyrimidine-specific ribonucleoside hydrolase
MKRVLLDCDPGTDDSMAIIFAIKSEELKVEAISCVSGNLTADKTSRNALKILDLIGADEIPVAKGMMTPLVRPHPRDPFSHGADGLGNTGLPESRRKLDPRFAPDLIIDTIRSFPNEIMYIGTGPMTNLALALLKAPDIANLIQHAFLIAGAFGFNQYSRVYATGDNPVSEWNVYVDPEAAKIVFHSGLPITAIGVDVFTHPQVNFREEHLQAFRQANNKESRYVLDLVDFILSRDYQPYCVQIDTMAVAAAIDGTIVLSKKVHADIETKSDLTLGQTVTDVRAYHGWDHLPQIEAAYDFNYSRYLCLLVDAITK